MIKIAFLFTDGRIAGTCNKRRFAYALGPGARGPARGTGKRKRGGDYIFYGFLTFGGWEQKPSSLRKRFYNKPL
ncbi:hypothetical protein PVT67_14380 [Gallaecimonas kandeliae]|uniref:hypothetical protein n=1 Tax=Gallaecimonas kandeliae TaxID=3029055 RepID=UPI002648E14D|nr:hypothetical protein [Gallaecimonas kandeliae]WKE64841.1 hypothetical protein PVT67_14380 [Gallaecimonas kandeliae]